jgi:hypothetical protein
MRALAAFILIAMSDALAAYAAEPVELATFKALERPTPTVVLQYGSAATACLPLGE